MCNSAKVEVLLHDFRRTAVRNLIRAGVSRDVARKISGHETDSIFSRYNTTDENDLADAAQKLEISRKLATENAQQLKRLVSCSKRSARVAELADALASGASDRKVVEVRVLSRAPSSAFLTHRKNCFRDVRLTRANIVFSRYASRYSATRGFKPYT